MTNLQKKLFFLPIVFLFIFLSLSQAVFSDDFGYKSFEDESTKKYGYKDSSGKLVIPAKFNWARPFGEGLAGVQIGEKYGFINKNGKLVIPAKFDDVSEFSEGLAGANIGNKCGYINKTGKFINAFILMTKLF